MYIVGARTGTALAVVYVLEWCTVLEFSVCSCVLSRSAIADCARSYNAVTVAVERAGR
jgi:hypothetical protein